MGTGNGPVNIIVSTVIKAEHIVPLLLEYKSKGRSNSTRHELAERRAVTSWQKIEVFSNQREGRSNYVTKT